MKTRDVKLSSRYGGQAYDQKKFLDVLDKIKSVSRDNYYLSGLLEYCDGFRVMESYLPVINVLFVEVENKRELTSLLIYAMSRLQVDKSGGIYYNKMSGAEHDYDYSTMRELEDLSETTTPIIVPRWPMFHYSDYDTDIMDSVVRPDEVEDALGVKLPCRFIKSEDINV